MNYLFEINGDIRNFTKEEFSNLLDILGQSGIDNFAELVSLYQERFNCNRIAEKLKKEQQELLENKERLKRETEEVENRINYLNSIL